MSNTFGQRFRITSFGESHGGGVGVVIDGAPSKVAINLDAVQGWLNRRKPGASHLTSPRKEDDLLECLSGLDQGVTLGTPISLLVRNKDQIPAHYQDMAKVFRPSHADYTYWAKYGVRAASGGGRASARETIARVAAAGIAEQILQTKLPEFRCVAWVDSVKGRRFEVSDTERIERSFVDQHATRAGCGEAREAFETLIVEAQKKGDTVGGTIACVLRGLPVGLGEPVFDKFEADLAKAMLSLPASKGFEIGSGFASTDLYGSEHNDEFVTDAKGQIRTKTNRSGGVQGGITNGEAVVFRVAFKPVATVFKEQQTVDTEGKQTTLKPKAGRHDPCVLPRAVPMVEAMATLVAVDHLLRQASLNWSLGR